MASPLPCRDWGPMGSWASRATHRPFVRPYRLSQRRRWARRQTQPILLRLTVLYLSFMSSIGRGLPVHRIPPEG